MTLSRRFSLWQRTKGQEARPQNEGLMTGMGERAFEDKPEQLYRSVGRLVWCAFFLDMTILMR